jgi:hypothetical protein
LNLSNFIGRFFGTQRKQLFQTTLKHINLFWIRPFSPRILHAERETSVMNGLYESMRWSSDADPSSWVIENR